jgi:hypothetical protein
VTFALDLQGRGEVWLPDGDWLLVLVDERGYAFERLTAGAEPAARPVLKLQPFEEVQGVVVDEQGAPVAGARVSVFRSRSSGGRRDAEGQALDAIAQLARQRYLNAVTEADGRFRLRFLSRPGTSMEARAAFEGKRSEGFPVAPTAEPLRLEVR